MSVADLPLPPFRAAERAQAQPRRDGVAIAVTLVLFAALASVLQFRGTLAEYDLYWMLVGLLDGQATGLGTGAGMHYGLSISFGYYEAMDHLLPAAVLSDPARLIGAMNAVGLVSSLWALAALAVALRVAYGARTAFVTVALFGFSPLYFDMALSGHPMLPALACVFTGAVLLFVPASGWRRWLFQALAALLLFAGLAIRAEVLIAFGWLAVARADYASPRAFLASVAERATPPALALAAFFVAQRSYVDPQAGGSGTLVEFMRTFYDLKNIGRGVGFLLVGLGPALALASVAATISWIRVLRAEPRVAALPIGVDVLALALPCLALWLPNPSPARHFAVLALGAALLIGWVVARRRWPLGWAIAAVAVCLVGNELLSEALRPTVIARLASPYVEFPERDRTLTQAPIGYAWQHHEAMQERHEAWDAQSDLMRRSCDRRVIVLGDESFEMITGLYRDGTPPRLSHSTVGGYGAVTALRPDGQRFDFIEAYHAWPVDAVARLLAASDADGAAILQVPWSRSIHDLTPVPADRQPSVDCHAPPQLRGSL